MMEKVTLLIRGNLKSLGRIAPAREGGGRFLCVLSDNILNDLDISTATVIEGDVQVDNFFYDGFVVVIGHAVSKK